VERVRNREIEDHRRGLNEDRAAAAARITEFAPYLRPLYADADTRLYESVGWPKP
jgi:hypothetical protein